MQYVLLFNLLDFHLAWIMNNNANSFKSESYGQVEQLLYKLSLSNLLFCFLPWKPIIPIHLPQLIKLLIFNNFCFQLIQPVLFIFVFVHHQRDGTFPSLHDKQITAMELYKPMVKAILSFLVKKILCLNH